MALTDIVKNLEDKTSEKISKVKAEAEQERDALRVEYQSKIDEARKRILASAKREANKKTDMKVFAQQSELRNKVLNQRRQLLDKVYQQAIEDLKSISDSEYEKLIKHLMEELPSGGVIIPAQGREEATKKVAHQVKTKFEISSESVKAAGGFVWQSQDVNIDNTFEQLITDIRTASEMEIAKVLFT